MALHIDFPDSPHTILDPELRWFPADETLRETGSGPKTPLMVEVDNDNTIKDIDALDVEIPILTPRAYREYKHLFLSMTLGLKSISPRPLTRY